MIRIPLDAVRVCLLIEQQIRRRKLVRRAYAYRIANRSADGPVARIDETGYEVEPSEVNIVVDQDDLDFLLEECSELLIRLEYQDAVVRCRASKPLVAAQHGDEVCVWYTIESWE